MINSDTSLRSLGLLCVKWSCKPFDILELARQGTLQGMLEDEVARLESEGKAGSYIKNIVKPVKSWLEYNGLELKRRIKIKGVDSTPTLEQERVPTREELATILRYLDKRGKAMATMMVFAGLRIECIGNYDGSDGLIMNDLPEMRIEASKIVFDKVPTMVKVRVTISKIRRAYFTFLIEEGCIYLKEYLEWRIARGETLSLDTPVFGHSAMARKVKRRFLWGTKAGGILRGSEENKTGIRGAGFPWRPYVLRSYADTAFDISEAKGLISHPWRQFFMGHKGDIEARYSTNKARLPPDMVEEMRSAYKKCEPFLSTEKQVTTSENQIKNETRRQFFFIAGFSEEEISKMDLNNMSSEDVQLKARERMLGAMLNNGSKQKVINLGEVEQFISQGWEYINTIGDKAIMKLPT